MILFSGWFKKATGTPEQKVVNPGSPVPFGYKINWFAIASTDLMAIAAILDVDQTVPVGWAEGVATAYADSAPRIFISPPIDGWTLVAGCSIPHPCDESHNIEQVDLGRRFRHIFTRLADHAGEVQFFGNHRVVDFAAWARARRGRIERVFAVVASNGEVTANEGPQTIEEAELGFADLGSRPPRLAGPYLFELLDQEDEENEMADAPPSAAAPERPFAGRVMPGEDHVMALAAKWSVDPTRIGERRDIAGTGWVGRLPQS
jgi:hypothetical protein